MLGGKPRISPGTQKCKLPSHCPRCLRRGNRQQNRQCAAQRCAGIHWRNRLMRRNAPARHRPIRAVHAWHRHGHAHQRQVCGCGLGERPAFFESGNRPQRQQQLHAVGHQPVGFRALRAVCRQGGQRHCLQGGQGHPDQRRLHQQFGIQPSHHHHRQGRNDRKRHVSRFCGGNHRRQRHSRPERRQGRCRFAGSQRPARPERRPRPGWPARPGGQRRRCVVQGGRRHCD